MLSKPDQIEVRSFMLFYTGKLVQFFVSPIIVSLGLLAAAALARRRRPVASGRLLLGGIVVLWLSSTNFAAHWLTRGLESQYPIVESTQMPTADAIVLLGGTVYPVEPPRIEAEELGGSRALRAARLFQAGKAPKIVVAGGTPYHPTPDTTRNEATDMEEVLVAMGIPTSAIVREDRSTHTNENAINTAAILKERGDKSVLLVTSAYHMPRAVALFEREGLTVSAAPCDVRAVGNPWLPSTLVPSPEALKQTTLALKEYVGYWGYRLLRQL